MPQIPKNIRDIVNKKQDFIDANRGKLESSVIKMQEELLNKFIEEILPELDTKDGQILNTPKNMKLIERLDSVYEQFNKTTQSKIVKNLGETLLSLNKPNLEYFKEVALNEVTSKRFDQVVKNTNNLMAARLGINKDGEVRTGGFLDSFVSDRTLLTELKQMTIRNVTGQQSLTDFKKSLKDKIVGNNQVSGGFEKYYRTFAYDLYQEYDRAYGKQMATEFGMDYAIYQGGLIDDSRDFCRDHEDHVYTREEIAEFGKWTYAKAKNITTFNDPGKQEGIPSYIDKFPDYDPFVHCGGFQCRHSLSWITKSAAIRLRHELTEEKPKEAIEKKLKDTSKSKLVIIDFQKVDNVMDDSSEAKNSIKNLIGLEAQQKKELKLLMKTNNLSIDEASIIRQYTGKYKFLNNRLRSDNPNDNVIYTRDKLNEVLDKLPNDKSMVNRWIKIDYDEMSDFINKHKKNSIVEYKGFLSTSKSTSLKTRQGNIIYKIKSKTGKNISPLSEFYEEKEVLFKAGSKFKINSIEEIDGEIHIEMEDIN